MAREPVSRAGRGPSRSGSAVAKGLSLKQTWRQKYLRSSVDRASALSYGSHRLTEMDMSASSSNSARHVTMSSSLFAARSSRLAVLISAVAVGAFWSAPAEATCPNGLTNSSCRAVCSLNTTSHDYECDTTNPGDTQGAEAWAVSNYTSAYHSVWGTDSTNTAFCCEVLGSTVDRLVLVGGSYDDYLYFHYGNNQLDDLYGTMQGVMGGAPGQDRLEGSSSTTATYTEALGGDDDGDEVYGYAGADTLNGGGGLDIIDGGSEDDTIWGGADIDTIDGGSGNDTINGSTQDDIISGGTGNDTIYGDEGSDTIYGGSGNDSLYGNDDVDEIFGDAGDDEIWGGNQSDLLHGGDDVDTIRGDGDDDIICGDDGIDSLLGGGGADTIWGGAGVDTSNGGTGTDDCGSPAPPSVFTSFCENALASEPLECQ